MKAQPPLPTAELLARGLPLSQPSAVSGRGQGLCFPHGYTPRPARGLCPAADLHIILHPSWDPQAPPLDHII